MRSPQTVLETLRKHAQKAHYQYERLYRNLYNPQLYLLAYQNLYANMGYVTNAEAGHGLLRVGGAIVPFANEFPRTGALYQLWNTTPTDK